MTYIRLQNSEKHQYKRKLLWTPYGIGATIIQLRSFGKSRSRIPISRNPSKEVCQKDTISPNLITAIQELGYKGYQIKGNNVKLEPMNEMKN